MGGSELTEPPRGKRNPATAQDFRAKKKQKKKHSHQQRNRQADNSETAGRRDRVDQSRRRVAELGESQAIWADTFSVEEIKNEPRRPKHKVALIFGYAGTGYHGSQIERSQPTIEGDLFRACVRSGAVSKANSDDPKKVSWIRCSRTDRNVHAAANVVSALLIVQGDDIVQRINSHLPPQIRLWGYEKLNKSFNAHQRCEGRVYQYWIPTFCFLPPHPRSFLGSEIETIAKERGAAEELKKNQNEVADYWSEAEKKFIAPVILRFPAEVASAALVYIFDSKTQSLRGYSADGEVANAPARHDVPSEGSESSAELDSAIQSLKDAYKLARRSYRIDSRRLKRIQESIREFNGTHNYWNYTVRKHYNDASAKRFMTACTADETPVVVDGTEWLPLKFQGQSFMMNQIRKMVSMIAMLVRCGSPLSIVQDSFSLKKLTIPKAPPTGLLLERPVFDSYNKSLDRLQDNESRGRIEFEKYRTEIEAFKRGFIVEPMHQIEEQDSIYHNFFLSLDSLRSSQLLYFSPLGIKATERTVDNEDDVENLMVEDEGQGVLEGEE